MNIIKKQYWDLNNEDMHKLYELGQASGALESVFYDTSVSPELFELFARRAECFGAIQDEQGTFIGLFFLNHFEGGSARLNLGLFNEQPISVIAWEAVIEWCFNTFEFRCLTFVMPAHQQKRTVVSALGWQYLGIIPGMCWVEKRKRCVDGHLYVTVPYTHRTLPTKRIE